MNTRLTSIVMAAALAATLPVPSVGASRLPPAATIPTPVPSPVLPAAPSVAPGYKAPLVTPESADIIGVTQQPFVGLSLSDAIGMALLKNSDLAVSAANARIATYQIRAAKGAYDVRFFVQPSVEHSKSAPQNAFFSGPNFGSIVQNRQSVQTGLQGQTASGGQYRVSLIQTRVDDNTIINAFNPYYLASLNVQVSQPLLKGSGAGNDSARQLRLSEVNAENSQAQMFVTASQAISNVSNTYWDLVAQWRNVAIQEDALHQALLQQQSNVRLAKRGAAAPIDAVESSTQVAVYQDDVFSALQSVARLQNQLKSLIVNDPADPIWQANLVPTSSALAIPRVAPLAQILANAMQHRPELLQIAAAARQADINYGYARNQLLPGVDLQVNYQGDGFAGNALPPISFIPGQPAQSPPSYLGGTYGQAYGNIGKFPTYQVGVVISAPIGNNTAKANLAAAQEQQRIAKIQSAGLDQRIVYEVRNALQTYQSALSRLDAARRAREAAAQVYASERRKFRNGESTTYLVFQRQVALVENEGRELQAQTDVNKAVVELQRVDGTILSANNVTLNTVGEGAAKP
ncbi:MAG: TolC family protein [Candidatus Eremiobacteraeota bacterium]|nr:TolC family protein [Candidatus Eremiobacteraeota bacterium]